jgi:hypothetical protein
MGATLRPPAVDDFATGPCVAVSVPRRAYVSWVRHQGGHLVEVYIGGERTGGVYLTVPTACLGRLIGQLRAVRGTIPGHPAADGAGLAAGSRYAADSPPVAVAPTGLPQDGGR